MDRMNVKKELSKRAQSEKSYWPHLVGKRGVEAVTAIKAEKPSLKVVTVLEVLLHKKRLYFNNIIKYFRVPW